MKDLFRERLIQMQDFYAYTERELIELSYIIPLENKPETYSPRLYNLLQSTCAQVENLSKILCEKLKLNHDKHDFPWLYEALNVENILEDWCVAIIRSKRQIQPFKKDNKTPFWWNKYNETKHNLPDGITQGNIENTINALAGLFVLHNLGRRVKDTPDKDIVLKRSKLSTMSPDFDMTLFPEKQKLFPSQLFISLTYYSSWW